MDRFLMEPCGFRLLGWLRWCNGRHSFFLSLFSYSFFILLHSSHHFSLAILARFFIYILNKIPIFSSSSMAYLHTHTLFLTSLITHSHVKHSAQKKNFFGTKNLFLHHFTAPRYTISLRQPTPEFQTKRMRKFGQRIEMTTNHMLWTALPTTATKCWRKPSKC